MFQECVMRAGSSAQSHFYNKKIPKRNMNRSICFMKTLPLSMLNYQQHCKSIAFSRGFFYVSDIFTVLLCTISGMV